MPQQTDDSTDDEQATIVFSGGPDSTAAAKWAIEQGYEPELVSYRFDDDEQYGEMRAAMNVAQALDERYDVEVTHKVIDFSGPLQTAFEANTKMFRHAGVGGALEDDEGGDADPVPEDDESGESEDHLAPFASGILLSLTSSYALYNGIHNVVWGATKDDGDTEVTYQEGFSDDLGHMVQEAVGADLDIHVPINEMHKFEIVEEAYSDDEELFAKTWSCKEPVGDTQCGVCHACVARRVAAKMAGVEDNSEYDEEHFDAPFSEEQMDDPDLIPEQDLIASFKTI